MSELLEDWEKKSAEHQKQYKYFLEKVVKNDHSKNKVLRQLPDLHEEAFSHIDCMKCANCCKNYSPRFNGG